MASWTLLLADPLAAQQYGPSPTTNGYGSQGVRPSYYLAQNSSPATDDKPVLKAYPYWAEGVTAMAARLQEEFRGMPDVRIVADERTSQILAMAPPSVQVRVANLINGALQGVANPAAAPLAQPASQTPKSQIVALKHVTAQQAETQLLDMLRGRLTEAPRSGVAMKNYQLALPGGGAIGLAFDSQTNQVTVQGPGEAVDSAVRLMQTLDSPEPTPQSSTRLLPLQASSPAGVRRAIEAMRASGIMQQPQGPLVSMLFQQPEKQPEQPAQPATQPATPPAAAPAAAPGQTPAPGPATVGGLIGPVQVEMLEGLDVLVIRGNQRDVEQVMKIIEEIEKLSVETVPTVEIYALQNVNGQSLAALITPLYTEVFSPRQGTVSITALVKPNALLLVGRDESVKTAIDLIKKLDTPVDPQSQFQVFRLRYASAWMAQSQLEEFFSGEYFGGATSGGGGAPGGPGAAARTTTAAGDLRTKVLATADFRSNSLIVRASPRDMVEVAAMIARIDTPTSQAVNELRVFKLSNSLAETLAPILLEAINSQSMGMGMGVGGAGRTGAGVPQGAAPIGSSSRSSMGGAGGLSGMEPKSTMLTFSTVDSTGEKRLKSGILTDVKITADARANALLVSAPDDSMSLIAAVIAQLDQLPSAETQIKVFTIVNSDATALLTMLRTLFGQTTGGGAGAATGAEPLVQTSAMAGESSLVPLRFAVDVRTNTIIASGSLGDLSVIEAILLRLDDSEVRHRQSVVYQLKNAPAADVAAALTQFLQSEQAVLTGTPGLLSTFEQVEQEVVVVAEPVRNALLISATPRFYEEVMRLVEKLDEQPPMVVIQVLLAEVELDNIEEFGVELGLQDSILFDRSAAGAGTLAGTNVPGFLFNNQPLGNGNSATALTNPQLVGGQALSSFGVQRTNSSLGYGGLVLSASSESVSVLIRALRECRRLEVLSRPQIMTLDNQPAQIQVGQRVARVTGTSVNSNASTTEVQDEDVGLILGVVPRITPDGLVVMEIRATKSEMGSEAEGTPISVSISGEILRQPPINITTAETTVATPNGQTVILGGLITKTKSVTRRRTPWLSDVPVLGNLFRFDSESLRRTELLIIMTPHVVRNRDDLDAIKQVEAARMHWCLGDVVDVHGDPGIRGAVDTWTAADTRVVYPDLNPDGSATPPEDVPVTPQPTGPDGGSSVPEAIPTPPAMPDESASAAPRIRLDGPRIGPGEPRPVPAATQVQMRPIEEAYLRPASGMSLPASYSAAQPVVYPAAYQPVNPVAYPPVSPAAYPPAFPPTPPAATLNGVQPAVYQGPDASRTPAFQTPANRTPVPQAISYPTAAYPTAGTYPGPAVAAANLPNTAGPVVASTYQTPAYQPSARPPVSQPSQGNQTWPASQPSTMAGSPAYRTSTAVQPAQPNMPLYR